jgi:exodeoxyribonuclease-3
MVKLVTWNVNSVRIRVPLIEEWLKEHQPDIVLFQELKCVTEAFPNETFEDLGYNCAVIGQKSYNGVAILSKEPIDDVYTELPGFEDVQARYIEAFTGNVRVASVYVPNGQEVDSDKYLYKLEFMQALRNHLQHVLSLEEAQDMHTPLLSGTNHILISQKEQEALREILYMGFTDALRISHPDEPGLFTWWDYRAGSFEQNRGLRIDHFLLSPQAADRFTSAEVATSVRGLDRASDHAPVICVLA